MNLRFTDLTERDFPAVKAIYDWYILNSTATFHTEPIQIDQLREFIYLDHPIYKSYLIYDGERLAGYGILTNHKKRQAYDRTAEITIYLAPGQQRKGIGKRILQHLEDVAVANGLKNLLGVITGDNTASIALFESAGYVKCAHYKNVGEKFNKVLDVVAYQKEI